MALRERSATDAVVEARERYVAAGVATASSSRARRARGSRTSTGALHRLRRRPRLPEHRPRAARGGRRDPRAGRPLPPPVLHGRMYEPYVESVPPAGRALAVPGRAEEPARELGRRGGRERGQDRARRDRASGGRRLRPRLPRTLLTMTMTSKVVPYKRGFGPFAPEVYRAGAPYPYRGVSTDDAIHGLEALFKSDVDPEAVACVVLEPVQGEGGFIPMPSDFPLGSASSATATGSSTSTTRCRAASGAPARSGRSSTTASSPTSSSPASRSAASLWPASPAGPRSSTRSAPAVSAARSGEPRRLRGRERRPRRDRHRVLPAPGARARRADREALDGIATRVELWARCAGSGRCSRSSSSRTATQGAGSGLAAAAVVEARERGLVLLSCGSTGTSSASSSRW